MFGRSSRQLYKNAKSIATIETVGRRYAATHFGFRDIPEEDKEGMGKNHSACVFYFFYFFFISTFTFI